MNEFFHAIEHAIGLCGEKHINFLAILFEWPSFHYIFSYIKHIFK